MLTGYLAQTSEKYHRQNMGKILVQKTYTNLKQSIVMKNAGSKLSFQGKEQGL
jgi:hypothetical protein